jgi:hypothetical protein
MCIDITLLGFLLAISADKTPGGEAGGAFIHHEGLIFTECQINGTDALCLIDTGANVSAIDDDLAARLELVELRETQVLGTTGTASARMVKVDGMQVHGVEAAGIEMTKRDIRHGLTPGGRTLDVIVGFDFLRGRVMRVDFGGQKLTFPKEAPECRQWAPLKIEEGIPQVSFTVNGQVETRLRMDTGASIFESDDTYVNLVEDDLAKILAADPDLKSIGAVSSTGVGGELRMPIYALRSLRLGETDVPRPKAIIQPKQGYFSREGAVGFFGNTLLEGYSPVVLDYKNERLGLECR